MSVPSSFPAQRAALVATIATAALLISVSGCSSDADTTAPSDLVTRAAREANVLVTLPNIAQIELGPGHSCALDAWKVAWCWGMNWAGELGDGTTGFRRAEPRVVYKKAMYERITLGFNFTCGLDAAKKTWCWGANWAQQLADGSTTDHPIPAIASTPLFEEIDAGYNHACGVDGGQKVWCWGENTSGELGAGFTSPASSPVLVSGEEMKGVTAGVSFTCAIAVASQQARCWGLNDEGQLGDGSTTDAMAPVAVAGGVKFFQLSAGRQFACGVTTGHKVMCWGSNERGRLGTGSGVAMELTPVNVGLPEDITMVHAGYHHACALGVSGSAYCWGANYWGQLGDGTIIDHPTPVMVAGGFTFSSLRSASSGGFNCAIVASSARCWGSNNFGQLGDGTFVDAWTP